MPQHPLDELLEILDQQPPIEPADIAGYQVQRVSGGSNNLLYRATGDGGDFAIKFTLNDGRDRAGREYHALIVLFDYGLDVAARPVLLERDRYSRPLVVQTWIPGEIHDYPPQTEADWLRLLRYLNIIHQITPQQASLPLQPAIVSPASPDECRRIVQEQVNRIPEHERPAVLNQVLQRFENLPVPAWDTPQIRLIRSDANNSNFVWTPDTLHSVDWEYSGWGDPAFEIVDLVMHPAYLSLTSEQRAWVLMTYCELAREYHSDNTLEQRMQVYSQTMAAWWVARFCRYLYEIPRGLDPRLIERAPDAQATGEARLAIYLERAAQLLG
ncbi:MAG: aminoglycoside phosphotransferase family protein [Anaerolineae bacterium]|nr:aminoglycoside phosphotransferase family protein [Anaerolineae bacterium]